VLAVVQSNTYEEREREFIGTNIKQFHAKIKLRPWDIEKNCKTGCLVGHPSKVS